MRVLSTEIAPVHSEALRAALKVGKANGDRRAWDLAQQHAPMGTKSQSEASALLLGPARGASADA